MNNLFTYSFLIIIAFSIIITIFFGSTLTDYSTYNINEEDIYISDSGFAWPIPNFYHISSYFGHRTSPTSFASSYHSGLDIPAPESTYFLASISGTVTNASFKGSGGYTIIIQNEDILVTYCHVSPEFLVNVRRSCRTRASHRTSWTFPCIRYLK